MLDARMTLHPFPGSFPIAGWAIEAKQDKSLDRGLQLFSMVAAKFFYGYNVET
jgi:hypothetical protein